MTNWYDGFLLDKNNCIVGFNKGDKTIRQQCIFDEITHGMFTVYRIKMYDHFYKKFVNHIYTLCNDKLVHTDYNGIYYYVKLEDIIFKKDYYFYIKNIAIPTLVLVYYKANHILTESIVFKKSNENNIVENLKRFNYYSDADKWLKQNKNNFYEQPRTTFVE